MLIAKCAHDLFLCIGFSFSGCYSSQQFRQNNILFTTIKFKTLQNFQGLEFSPIKFKAYQDFQNPVWTMNTQNNEKISLVCVMKRF